MKFYPPSMITQIKQSINFLLLTASLMACVILNTNAQIVAADKIIPDGKIKWDDFTGPVEADSKYGATIYWRINYKYKVLSFRGDTAIIDLQVSPLFKGKSWVLPNKKTDELLAHEQGHFDLAIIGALKFKKIATSTILLKGNYAEKINLIFDSILTDIRQMELQYDEETNHMLNRSEQARWNKKINDMLTDL